MGLTRTGGESDGQRRSEGFGRGQQQHSGLSSRSRLFASGRAGGYTALGLLLHGWPGREAEARDVYGGRSRPETAWAARSCSPSSMPSGFCAADWARQRRSVAGTRAYAHLDTSRVGRVAQQVSAMTSAWAVMYAAGRAGQGRLDRVDAPPL